MRRPAQIHHCTSEPLLFVGREAELRLLDEALESDSLSVLVFVGPGGQGKTALARKWIERLKRQPGQIDGLFFWSFYRGKDADECLRTLWSYVAGFRGIPDVAAEYCVDRLLERLRAERWIVIFDGAEVVQRDSGQWCGRFVHPELGRLLQELASEPSVGTIVVTTRFDVPELAGRRYARRVALDTLTLDASIELLIGLGVRGSRNQLAHAARLCGGHAKAVELLGAWLVEFHDGDAAAATAVAVDNRSIEAEETGVRRVLRTIRETLDPESLDILALTAAFYHPPPEERAVGYLLSDAVERLLHGRLGRRYPRFSQRGRQWVAAKIERLVRLRLLERVAGGLAEREQTVLDAHPVVRAAFGSLDGLHEQGTIAETRADFLRVRPDRRPPKSLAECMEHVELFHAWCDAGMWNEADKVYVMLENPKHRFLAPAFELALLLRFFPNGDWRARPLWQGFGRYRSLAICFELMGRFRDAVTAYRTDEKVLAGDSRIALGDIRGVLTQDCSHPHWRNLWLAYRAHALVLASHHREAGQILRALVPTDAYEWVHAFEASLRLRSLQWFDWQAMPLATEHRWAELARRRILLDLRRYNEDSDRSIDGEYADLIRSYDEAGLAFDRTLTRLSYARWLAKSGEIGPARETARQAVSIAERFDMKILLCDALELIGELAAEQQASDDLERARGIRQAIGYLGPGRP